MTRVSGWASAAAGTDQRGDHGDHLKMTQISSPIVPFINFTSSHACHGGVYLSHDGLVGGLWATAGTSVRPSE